MVVLPLPDINSCMQPWCLRFPKNKKFCCDNDIILKFVVIYLQDVTFHLLHHVPDGIEKYGPLYLRWAFPNTEGSLLAFKASYEHLRAASCDDNHGDICCKYTLHCSSLCRLRTEMQIASSKCLLCRPSFRAPAGHLKAGAIFVAKRGFWGAKLERL